MQFNEFKNDELQMRHIIYGCVLCKSFQKWFLLLESNRNEIASIMTSESGKPLAESLGEITYGNSFVEWFAEEARRIYGEIVPTPHNQKRIFLTREPIGVAALITPWNFPHAMITRKASAAIAAGLKETKTQKHIHNHTD